MVLLSQSACLLAGDLRIPMAMLLVFGTAELLAEVCGRIRLPGIVGEILAGMALGEHVERRVHRLTHGVSEMLVPFFLAGIGLHVDLKLFPAPRVLMLAALILVAALLSKFAGCGLAALRLGRADALRIGVGMVPRGEVGMVVAQLGLSMGAIGKETYGVAVFMAVATTILAPPMLEMVFRSVQPAVREAELAPLG
jgi:Kef-type K+ transport system membrane component KefB